MSDATDLGVSVEEAKVETALDPREAIFAAVDAKRKEELIEEEVDLALVLPEEMGEDNLDDELKAKDKEPIEPIKATVKIDGMEEEVLASDIVGEDREVTEAEIAEHQKKVAGDRRLEKAALKEKELIVKEQELLDFQRKLTEAQISKPAPVAEQPAKPEATVSLETAKRLNDAILTERPEEIQEAMGEVLSQIQLPTSEQQPGLTTEEVAQAADDAVARRDYNVNLGQGQKALGDDFPELVASTTLIAAVNAEAKTIFDSDPSKGPGDILIEAAGNVRKLVFDMTGKKSDEVDITQQNRLKRKQEAAKVNVKPSAPARADINKDQPPPPTRKNIVANMVADRNAALS